MYFALQDIMEFHEVAEMLSKKTNPLDVGTQYHSADNDDWFESLPNDAFVREDQIVASPKNKNPLLPVSSSTWWRMVRAGKVPKPIKLSAGVTAWRVGDLRSWLKSL